MTIILIMLLVIKNDFLPRVLEAFMMLKLLIVTLL